MPIERTDLPNGLAVVTESIPGSRSASFGCWVRVGGRDEPEPVAGASHFLEHLLFKGTEAHTGKEISEAIERVGGEINAHTAHEHTAFYARVPATATDVGLDLLSEVVASPAFTDADVDSERQVILEELHLAEDEGDDKVLSLAHEALWGDHPLGREVLGRVDSIEAMSRTEISSFFEGYYQPENLVLVAAGAVDHEAVVAAGERFAPRSGASTPPSTRSAPNSEPSSLRTVLHRPNDVAHLALAWPGLAADHPDRYALSVANQIFGGGLSSRLFQQVREERGLAYSVFSSVSAYSDAGSLVAYAGTSPDRAAEVVELIRSLAATLVTNGVTEREWAVARGYLEGAALLSLEDTSSVMARLGNHMCARRTVTPIDEQLERLRRVTVDDVDRVLRTHLTVEPVICAVGPLDEIGV
ncbi:MAG: insulinase family protein [Acidimicrobiales bacterium]|nr:insulinase family protein [Acidimicrobiales bacterium]